MRDCSLGIMLPGHTCLLLRVFSFAVGPDQSVEEDVNWESLCGEWETGSPEMLGQVVDVQNQKVMTSFDFGAQQRLWVRMGQVIDRNVSM
jgi:hypothetical protein